MGTKGKSDQRLPTQAERFEETARELGVELDEEKFKRALRRMKPPREKKGANDAD